MIILRFLGVMLALIITFVISLLTKIDFITIMSIVAFVLAVDLAVWNFISNIYMAAIYKNLDIQAKETKKRDEHGNNSGS